MMKSHRTQLLTIDLAILLILVNSLLAQSRDDDAQGEIELVNWINLGQNNWPEKDANLNDEFLVYHSEYSSAPLFGLNKAFFQDVDLVSKPELYFRYWANAESSFRSRVNDKSPPTRDVRLMGDRKWNSSDLKSISPEEWPTFAFVQQDLFTLALKDLTVKYVQKLHLDKLDKLEVTAYQETPNHDNFKESPTIKSGGIIHFNSTTATFNLASLNASSIKFELGQNQPQVSTTITITAFDATDNKTNIIPTEAKSLFSVTLDSANKEVLKEVKITLPKLGFTISKISYTEVNSTAGETVISLEDFIKSISGKLFTQLSQIQNVKGHVQFSDRQSTDPKTANKDICYSIQKVNPSNTVIEVYLTLRNAPVGFKLDTLESNVDKKEICLFDYIALQNLGTYMMTFVVSGSSAQSQFQFRVKTVYKNSQQKNLILPEGEVKSGSQWFYYNPQAFDYSIEIEPNSNSSAPQFLICDLVANCYPYESKDNNRKYILSESVQKELEQTQYVRIVASYSTTGNSRIPKFTNNVIERFNSKLLTDNPKSIINGKPTDLQFELKFDDQNEASITVPLDLIDLRAQLLAIDVKLNASDPQSRLTLLKLSYKIATESDAYNFPLEQFPQVQTKHFHLASDQLFDYGQSSIPNFGNSVSFTLRLDSPLNVQPKPKVILKFEIKQKPKRNLIKGKFSFTDDPKDGSKSSGIQIYPVDFKDKDFKDSTKKELILPANANRLLITNWIQAGTDQKLASSKLKTSFTVTSKINGDISNITLYRVILRSQGYPEFALLKDSTNQTKNGNMEIKFVDDITKDDDDKWKVFPTKGAFRIGYFIHSGFDATVVVDQFDVQGTELDDSVNNCLKEATVAYRDCQYEVASCPFGGDFNGNICNLRKINRFVETKCDMTVGCANILDRRLPVSSNYAVDSVSEYVPFQIEGQEEEHYLKYKRPTNFSTGDFCLDFTYQAKQSPLVVSASLNRNSSLGIDLPITELQMSNTKAKVCASWLTNEVDSVNEFYFRFVRQPLYEIDSHKLKFSKVSAGETEPVLPGGIYIDKLAQNQFIFPTPNDRFEYEFKVNEHGNTLKATLSEGKLKTLQSNTQKDNYWAYVSVLRTKWIKLAKSGEQFKIGFEVKNSDVHKVAKIQLKIHSVTEQIWQSDISAFKSNEIFAVKEASVFGQYYQVELVIELNQTKVLEIEKSIYSAFVLTLENFSINDPCVNSANKVEECSGVKQGTCVRSYLESNYSGICECKSFYYGNQCELEDYCAQEGPKICGKKDLCKNDVENRQVSCECEMPNQVWSAFLKSCINPQNLICSGPNEILQYVHNKPTCVCMDGFLMSSNQTCVAFDICNSLHRGIKSIKPPNPCQVILNSKCEPTNEKKPSDFTCVCKTGYFLDALNSKCLPENPCKSCEHRCNNIPSGSVEYKCDENCNNGYVYNEESKECEITDAELQNLSTNLGCPERKIELKDGKPACVCGDQKFDPITRGCSQSECSPEMLANCQFKGAIACKWAPFSWAPTKGTPICVCKEGDIAYSDSQNSSSAWSCMSRCDVLELPKQYRSRCTEPFSYCDPKKPFTKYVPEKGLQQGGWIEDVFQVNRTELEPTDKSHCACESGFRKDDNSTGKCIPYERPIHAITDMEFDWNPFKEEAAYLADVELAFRSLIIQVLDKGVKKGEIGELYGTKCVKKENETIISCSTNFESDQEDSNIVSRIKNACVHAGDDGKCFYLNLDTQLPKSQLKPRHSRSKRVAQDASISNSRPELSILVQDKSKQNNFQVQQKDFCTTKNICSKYSYSSCTSAEVKPFQCLCPKAPYFKVASSEPLGSQQQLNMETCEVVDLCHDSQFSCKDSNSTCTFHVERKSNGEYSPKSYCTCANTNIILASHENSCKTTCDGQCIHSDGCAQDSQTNKMICHCSDGWTGEKCDTKLTESTASKAYLISIIVVSIIAVAELIGLGVIYFRRR